MREYWTLRAWHAARDITLTLSIEVSARANWRLPGFRSQLLRAALSVASNLAEGSGARSPRERRRYFDISLASLREVESDLDIGLAAQLLSSPTHANLARKCAVVRRMIAALIAKLDADS